MGNYLPESTWGKVLVGAAYALLGVGAGYLVFFYLLPAVLPILLGYLSALCLRPLARLVQKKTKMRQSASGGAAMLLCALVLGMIVVKGGTTLVSQASAFGDLLRENTDTIAKQVTDLAGKALSFLPESLDREAIRTAVSEGLTGMLGRVAASAPGEMASFVASLPGFLLFLTVYTSSTFFFSVKGDAIGETARRILPPFVCSGFDLLKRQIRRISLSYLRAALLLSGLTCLIVYLGLRLLGMKYALLLSVVIAIIDLLPILGAGSVLIPWTGIALLGQDFRLGAGLLVIFAVLTIARQLLEPRLIGRGMGISPFVTLSTMYAGYVLFGFWGLLLLPGVVTLLLQGLKWGKTREKSR